MMNRRVFFKVAAGLGALLVLPKVAFAEALKLIDTSGKTSTDAANKTAMGIAKGLNYVADVAKAAKDPKFTAYPEKSGVKMADQKCKVCTFYQCVDGAKGGKCTLIPGVLVHEAGGCMSWVKIAAPKPCVKNA
jgi:hypothetical protein